MELMDYLMGGLVAIILIAILIPVILNMVNGQNWTVTIASTTIDFAVFLLVILVIFFMGLVYFIGITQKRNNK